jgi:hypothetical protein
MQLSLEVVDIVLGSNQLILSVLQSGMGVVEVISLEVTAAISPYQLIIQIPDARLQVGVLLQKLPVALLDVLDDTVLGLHLIGGSVLRGSGGEGGRGVDAMWRQSRRETGRERGPWAWCVIGAAAARPRHKRVARCRVILEDGEVSATRVDVSDRWAGVRRGPDRQRLGAA